jgi:uncharacterized phage protein gp47/JayE
MTGANLDAFVQLFGMSRYPAARATGTVTFVRGTATDVISVPINTQVATSDGTVTVQTLAAVILDIGALSASVPVQAVTAGPDGNVAASTLTVLLTPVSEISAVTNAAATTGGSNQETDTQLQQRWISTVFKSMSGTDQMFLGLALNNPACTSANVIGASKQYTEQLQIVGGGATSTVTDAQYVYPTGQVVGQDIDDGNVAVPGLQYTWNYSSIPPSITVIDSSYFPNGQIVDVQFNYIPTASRNQPSQSIYNRVDVWCNGTNAASAAQSLAFSTGISFSSSASNNYYAADFVRPDGTNPVAGNIFIPLAYGPIITLPPTLTVGAATYGLATATNPLGTTSGGIEYAYQIVHRTGAFGWSPYSDFGMEWVASMAPASGTAVTISEDYTWNNVPYQVQQDIANWRLAATDVQAHQAVQVLLQFSLAVIYDPSITQSVTNAAISTALSSWLGGLGFNADIYPSSVIQTVENTPGVIASRFLVGADYPSWNPLHPNASNVGIQQLSSSGAVINSYVDGNGNPVDILLDDMSVPAFGNLVTVAKAGNTLGSFT